MSNADQDYIGGVVKKVQLAKYENKTDENGNLILDENGEPVKEDEPFEVWEGDELNPMKRVR